jgi:AraC family transcriptional regulator
MLAAVGSGAGAEEKKAPLWLPRVVELLHATFRQHLTVADVASEVGLHPIHLSKTFRKFQRQSIGEYVHRLRIQYACRELLHTETSLAEIALSAGFSDQSHFTRVFKQLTGNTPGDFRRGFGSDATPQARPCVANNSGD